MIGRLPPEAAATPSEQTDRRARHHGLVVVAAGLLAAAGAVTLGSGTIRSDLRISVQVIHPCTISKDIRADSGGDSAARDSACPAQRTTTAPSSNQTSSNQTGGREDRVTSYIF